MPVNDPEIVSLGSDLISNTAPAGDSVRYDPEFEQLAAEIAKMESIAQVTIDWDSVVQLSKSILKTKSKDYRVAAYMLMGLYHARGFDGLLNGFRMYHALIKNFWETGFPENSRLRARIGALEWLSARLSTAVSRDARKPASDEVIFELESAFKEFLNALNESLGDQVPGFTELQAEVDARAKEVRARMTAADRAKEEEERRAAAAASGEVTEVADADRVTEECREKMSRVAGFLYQSDPADPLSYRLSRSITWGWLVSAPSHENGVTQIPPVPEDVIQRYNSLSAEKNWIGIVGETESNYFDRVFGFSLQRRCVQALIELGEQYDGPRQAILSELTALCARLPEIIKLRFIDDSPFADAETVAWIENEVLAQRSGAGAAKKNPESGAGQESSELAEASTEARRLMANGRLQEAIALFKDGIAKSPLRRFRFLWKLQLAKLCMEAGRLQLALPQLASLDEDVGRFALEEWEPGLSLEVVQNLFMCRQKLAAAMPDRSTDVENQLAQLYQRLCKLDVNAALAVEF